MAFGESLTNVLEEKGYRVAVAGSGEEALDVVRTNGFDVIFIDVRMPVMNGLQIFLAMKKIKPDVKAVMMTGFRRARARRPPLHLPLHLNHPLK